MQCRTIAAADIGRRIFGVAIAHDLAMRLAPTAKARLRQLVEPVLAAVATLVVLGLLVRVRPRRLVLPFALVAATLLVVFLNDASFLGGVRPFDSGDDGLVYDGYARLMLQRLLGGGVAGALEGGEKVFYFTPGLRYLRAAEHLIFGETYLGYLSLVLVLPFLVFALLRRFLPLRWALALIVVFTAVPIGVLFGSSLVQYVKWAARGFADPAAYAFFLAALVLLLGRTAGPAPDRFGAAFGAGLLFALALFMRPNIAPAAGILLAGAGLAALWQRRYRRLAGLCIGFAPVFGMALHNWFYGGAFVLFTSTAAHPGALLMPPAAWLAALAELARFDIAGEHLVRASRQIAAWLAGPSESVVMAPLNAAALVVLVRVAAWDKAEGWLRLVACATLAQQCVGLFYASAGRYYYLTWLLTFTVVMAWLHGEGIELFRRRFPDFSARVAKHPASLALERGLDRMSRMLNDGDAPDSVGSLSHLGSGMGWGGSGLRERPVTPSPPPSPQMGEGAHRARGNIGASFADRRTSHRLRRLARRRGAGRGKAIKPCRSASSNAPTCICETNSPRRISRTISAGDTNFTDRPGSGWKPAARGPAATKKLWMRLLRGPGQAGLSPKACTLRAVSPVSSRSSRRQPSAGSSPGSTRPAGSSHANASSAGRYCRTIGIFPPAVSATIAM